MLHFITDFADQAVMLPVMVTVALIMAVNGWWRGAVVWAVTAVMLLAVMLLLKIAGLYYAAVEQTAIISPSGHVAAACMVYGGLLCCWGAAISCVFRLSCWCRYQALALSWHAPAWRCIPIPCSRL